MLGVIAIILTLIALMYFAYRGVTVLVLAPILAMTAVLIAGEMPPLHSLSEVFMPAAVGYVGKYLPVFLAGAIFYFGTIFLFLDKIKEKIEKKKEIYERKLIKTNKKLNAKTFINLFDSLVDQRGDFYQKKSMLDLINWAGVLFLIGSILGAIFQMVNIRQDLPLGMMAAGFIFFFILLVYFAFWYFRNK